MIKMILMCDAVDVLYHMIQSLFSLFKMEHTKCKNIESIDNIGRVL